MTIWRDLAPVLRLFADDCRNKLLLGALPAWLCWACRAGLLQRLRSLV